MSKKRFPTPFRWTPRFPEKYVGNSMEIWSRSSWETRLMVFLDETPTIICWSSETIVIPYISPVDMRQHSYYVDFVCKYRKRDGSTATMLIEVKPEVQTKEPIRPKRVTKHFVESVQTYSVNMAKWQAAEHFCKLKGWEWRIFTEKELNIKR